MSFPLFPQCRAAGTRHVPAAERQFHFSPCRCVPALLKPDADFPERKLLLPAARQTHQQMPCLLYTSDRLSLSPARVESMAEGMRAVAALPDPVGELLSETARPKDVYKRQG